MLMAQLQLSRGRGLLLSVALLFIILAWVQVRAGQRGLVVRNFQVDGLPLRYMAPEGVTAVPGILIAHGFAGSQQLMLGYGHVLAQAGYGVILWDFDGHGANPRPLDREGNALQQNIATAYDTLIAQPEIDAGRTALLGHSMGSGAVMTAAIEQPERYRAVVAVSPTGAEVSPERPPNLLLQAGEWEARFVENARDLLARAGGENDDVANGRARAFLLVPRVEHITILFNPLSHTAALDWFNETFRTHDDGGRMTEDEHAFSVLRPSSSVQTDRRMVWYGLHLLGWLLLVTAVSPLLANPTPPRAGQLRGLWYGLGLLLAPFLAALLLALLGRMMALSTMGGLLVGGALGLWFWLFGLVWLAAGFRPRRPVGTDLLWGLLLFGLLWMAFGAMAQQTWLSWWLIPERLLRWPLLAIACLPWNLAAGLVQQGAAPWSRFYWWFGQSSLIIMGLIVAIALTPALGFIILTLPVIPVVLGLMTVIGGAIDRPWAYAVGNALFFGWVITAVFPLA
jgi:pimeloyl-ACP methyl ester carboxylesterase